MFYFAAMMKTTALFCVLVAGCAADDGPELVAGFSPPAPGANEVQYLSPITRDIQPGEDRIDCAYLDAHIAGYSDIGRIAGYNSTGSHHIILYTTSAPQTPNVHACKEDEMVFLSMVGGTGGDAALSPEQTLPDGLVRRVTGGQQLVIQTHWINTTDEPMDGQAAFNVRYEPVDTTKTPTDFMSLMNTQFELAPGKNHAEVDCTFKDSLSIWQLAGHQHSMGKHIKITYNGKMLVDDDWKEEWSFNPKFLDFTGAPMQTQAGDKIHIECDWMNPGSETVRFPSEMCGAVAQYYPSAGQLICFNGSWLGD
jgi:hypothetical protein